MFKLTNKLALTNLIKNRRLYYPFAFATILVVAISYLFDSLSLNPHVQTLHGGASMSLTLNLGLVITTLAAAIIIFYANSFVMKNRSKELGLYGMLGLEKRHLMTMLFKEIMLFGVTTVTIGVGVGLVFDKLIYALLLKLIHAKVELVSTFQPLVLVLVYVTFGLIFAGLVLVNSWRILRLNALQLSKEKVAGEKQGRFLGIQTLLGLLSLATGYVMALSVQDPMAAIASFFLAVLLVIFGTYLLFNAGITVFLKSLKKNKAYYYQPNNMISVSNLIFRMKKNAVGLATIAILSTMVLVTMTGAINIYTGNEHYKQVVNPHAFSVHGKGVTTADLENFVTDFAKNEGLTITQTDTFHYANVAISSQKGDVLTLVSKDGGNTNPQAVFVVLGQDDVSSLLGHKLDLTDDQVALYATEKVLQDTKTLTINGQQMTVAEHVTKDFLLGHFPNVLSLLSRNVNYLIVKDVDGFASRFPDAQILIDNFSGIKVSDNEETQEKVITTFDKDVANYSSQLTGESFVYGNNGVDFSAEVDGNMGGILFIGIFLSIIFLAGTVLVIYYKQISEGYEDRDRFVILQKVGLDDKQIKQTIRKQVLTVFFLPLIFAFLNLGFAYHMMSLILQVLGVLNKGLMLTVTLSICGLFLLTYVAVFMITSRSYRKIVQL